MIRSFLAGLGWGGVIAAMGLGVVSQVAPHRKGDIWAAERAQVDAPAPLPVVRRVTSEAAPLPEAPEPPADIAPAPEAPEPSVDIAPPPEAPEPSVDIAPAPEAPEPSVDIALQPEAPEPSVDIVPPQAGEVAAADAAPAGPKLQPPPPALAPDAVAALAPPAPDAPATIAPAPLQPAHRPAGIADVPALADPARPPALDLALAAPEPAPRAGWNAPRLPAAALAEVPPSVVDPLPQPPLPAVVERPPERLLPGTPETFLPEPPLNEPVDGVVIGRLPRIGAPPPEPAQAEALPDTPPVTRYARVFDNPGALPLFTIILQDTGAADLDRASLAALPFPVSFAIDPLQPGAAAAAAIYRSAGQEVLMLASGIPEGATAADLEQTFQAHAQVLAEAVAVIDLPVAGFQNNRTEAAQVVPIVQAQGRGVITYAQGLNAAAQVAARDGVPSAEIFRTLDAEGEAAPVIRRYLDRAAFKAAQEGRVVVIGRTRPATIAALAEWALGARARTVALAPVSAAMAQ